jgi:hypothetical protein
MNAKGKSSNGYSRILQNIQPNRGLLFGLLILGALLAFEIFNYSTTDFALTDLMGDLRFLDVRWATILAIAFCAIDFAGIARLFTPERGSGEPKEVWYLFGAWLLAATMNAMLTWWGVAIAVLSHTSLGGSVISPETMIEVVPIFVAIMVWVIRVLIIGSFSIAGNRLFSQSEQPRSVRSNSRPSQASVLTSANGLPQQVPSFHPSPKSDPKLARTGYSRSEPTYHPVSMNSSNQNSTQAHK